MSSILDIDTLEQRVDEKVEAYAAWQRLYDVAIKPRLDTCNKGANFADYLIGTCASEVLGIDNHNQAQDANMICAAISGAMVFDGAGIDYQKLKEIERDIKNCSPQVIVIDNFDKIKGSSSCSQVATFLFSILDELWRDGFFKVAVLVSSVADSFQYIPEKYRGIIRYGELC